MRQHNDVKRLRVERDWRCDNLTTCFHEELSQSKTPDAGLVREWSLTTSHKLITNGVTSFSYVASIAEMIVEGGDLLFRKMGSMHLKCGCGRYVTANNHLNPNPTCGLSPGWERVGRLE